LESGSKATACTYFSSGSCQKGNECRFLHLPSSSATSYLSSLKERGIGVNKLKGGTTAIGGGLNSTSDTQVGIEKGGKSTSSSSSTSCYFFSIGKCSKGSSCPFQHIIAESTSSADPRSSLTIDFGKDMTSSKEESRNKGNDSMDMIDDDEEDNNTDNQTNNKSIKKATPSSSRESSFSYAIAAPSSSSFGRSGTSGSFLNLPEKIIKPSRKSITTSTDSTVASQTATVAAPRLSKKFTSTTTKEEDRNVLGHQQHQSLLSTTSSLSPGTTTRSRKAEILMALSLPSVVTTKTSSSSSSSSSGVPNYKGKIAG
jgi:hypothetical protein